MKKKKNEGRDNNTKKKAKYPCGTRKESSHTTQGNLLNRGLKKGQPKMFEGA